MAAAEAFHKSVTPGMSDKEMAAYRKVLKETKGKHSGGSQGGTPKKHKFGRGGFNNRGGGHGQRNFPSGGGGEFGGYDPFSSAGEERKLLSDQNAALRKTLRMLEEQNVQRLILIRAWQLESFLMSMKIDALKQELVSLLIDIKEDHFGTVPYKPSYLKDSSSVGPNQYGSGGHGGHGGYGGYDGGFGRGGRGRGGGGYRGNNYRGRGGGDQGGDRSSYGGNQTAGGSTN